MKLTIGANTPGIRRIFDDFEKQLFAGTRVASKSQEHAKAPVPSSIAELTESVADMDLDTIDDVEAGVADILGQHTWATSTTTAPTSAGPSTSTAIAHPLSSASNPHPSQHETFDFTPFESFDSDSDSAFSGNGEPVMPATTLPSSAGISHMHITPSLQVPTPVIPAPTPPLSVPPIASLLASSAAPPVSPIVLPAADPARTMLLPIPTSSSAVDLAPMLADLESEEAQPLAKATRGGKGAGRGGKATRGGNSRKKNSVVPTPVSHDLASPEPSSSGNTQRKTRTSSRITKNS